MDLIKKAKKSALALKSEVQGIIGTPGQQPGSYGYNPSQSSYNQSSPSYPQYGQTNPQVQNFQSQYGVPAQNYPQSGQPQSHNPTTPGPYHNAPSNQYNGPSPSGQQPPGIGGQQQFQQAQYGHPQNQQHQYQPQTGPPIGNQQHVSSQAQSQYQPVRVHNLIAPPWDPNAPSSHQNNPPVQTYQPTALNSPPPPGHFQGHQPSNPHPASNQTNPSPATSQNYSSMPILQSNSFPSIVQPYSPPPGSMPILQSHSFPSIVQPYSSPPEPQNQGSMPILQSHSFPSIVQPYSSPPVPQPYSPPQIPQSHQNQSGYFPPGQQAHPPNQVSQQQASNFMQNFVQNQPAQNQLNQNQPHHGIQSPPLPFGKPQPSPQNPTHQGFYHQEGVRPSQTPPLPPRQDTYPPPQQSHQTQATPVHGQAPQQNTTSFQPQQEPQQRPQQQQPQQRQPQQQQPHQQQPQRNSDSQHPSSQSHQASDGFSQPPPAYHTIGGQNTPLPGKFQAPQRLNQQSPAQITPLNSPPIQNVTPPPQMHPSQQQNIVPQPSRFSPRPVEQMPPPRKDSHSSSSQSQPPTKPVQHNIVTQPLRFSPRPIQGQMPQPPSQPVQQHNVVSQPSRFSPRPVEGQMPPPRQDGQSFPQKQQQQTQPLQRPNNPQSQTSVPSSPSPQLTGGQKPPLNQQRIPSPSASNESRRSPVQALPYSAPKPTQKPAQANAMFFNTQGNPPQQSQSRPPSQTSQKSPIKSTPIASQAQANKAPKPHRQTTSPPYPVENHAPYPVENHAPYPVDNHESFNQQPIESSFSRPDPSITPAPLNTQTQPSRNQRPLRQNTSPPVVEQFQNYNQNTTESPSLKPAPLNLQSDVNRIGTPPRSAVSPPPSKQHQTFNQPTEQGHVSQPSQVQSEGQYKAFRPTENPALKPAPLYSSQQGPSRQETISPPAKEYKAFSQKPQSPASNYTAFKPPGSRAEHGQVSPPKSSTPVPQISPQQSPAPTISQMRPQNQGQQLPYQVSPQLQQSRPVYEHQQSFQMPTPPPISQSPHAGMVSPISPSQKVPSFPQVFEMDSGEHIPSVPQGRPSFPTSQSGPIEFADGLISVEHEESNPAPSIQNKPTNRPAPVQQHSSYEQGGRELNPQRAPKTQCVEFEATLTDVNQFFEIHPAIVSQHGIQYKSGRDFVICEYCYHTFIAPHPNIASQFRPRPKGPQADKSLPISFEKMRGCGLAFPRIRQTILGQAIPQRNIQPLVEYLRLDATLSQCSGEPQTGSYFGTKAIEALVLCKSCFESYIKNTAFERNFSLVQTAPGQRWGCDWNDSGYLSRALLTDLAKNPPDFAHFARQANKRLAMPPCNGHKQRIAVSGPRGSTIFRSVEDNQGVFCSAHFYDLVVGTPAEQAFGYEIEIDEDQKEGLSCDLTFPFSINNMAKAVRFLNYQIWYLPIVASNTTYPCPIAGHDEGDLEVLGSPPWYHLTSHPTIEICERCYGTEVIPSQAPHLFKPITRPLTPGRIRQCHLAPSSTTTFSSSPMDYENTTAFRGHYLRSILTYCSAAGNDFTLFLDAATKISYLPPACGSNLRSFKKPSGRKWFGHQAAHPQDPNDATIIVCAECRDFAVKDTQMEGFMGNDLTAFAYSLSPEYGVRCATWSKQTKFRLRQACERGEFASFAQYHRQREDLYTRVSQAVKELDVLSELLMQRTGLQMDVGLSEMMGGLDLGVEHNEQGNMPGLNMVMWEMASPQRLEGEVARRAEILQGLKEEWVVLK